MRWYTYIRYGNKSRLVFTDTNSLMYEIKPKILIKTLVRIRNI